jgi:hypothetical protein
MATSSSSNQQANSTKSFEVFYNLDEVNAWLPCEVVDIVNHNNQHLQFRVRVTATF